MATYNITYHNLPEGTENNITSFSNTDGVIVLNDPDWVSNFDKDFLGWKIEDEFELIDSELDTSSYHEDLNIYAVFKINSLSNYFGDVLFKRGKSVDVLREEFFRDDFSILVSKDKYGLDVFNVDTDVMEYDYFFKVIKIEKNSSLIEKTGYGNILKRN